MNIFTQHPQNTKNELYGIFLMINEMARPQECATMLTGIYHMLYSCILVLYLL